MTSDVVIRAEGLGKKYIIGHEADRERYTTLRDSMGRSLRNWGRSARDMFAGKALVAGDEIEEFWALKDINFEIKRGDVVGIIGRNGAGKSTLLKVLSRITEPTTGRVTIDGRVASLLEVGTGFHPELSGRENIYLNGAILGMSRDEIKRKFDEIVDFAAVEKFLDTPVKRYSSGMYVRLAFAVAAHLEPEILIVDEVLAVGDAEFQKKCLGKMKDVAGHGRTVLFVSHNMGAVAALCGRALTLSRGSIQAVGPVADVIFDYQRSTSTGKRFLTWDERNAPGDNFAKLLSLIVRQDNDREFFSTSKPTQIEMTVLRGAPLRDLNIGVEIQAIDGQSIFSTHFTDVDEADWPILNPGLNRLSCELPAGLFNGGPISIFPRISVHGQHWIVYGNEGVEVEMTLDHSTSPFWTTQSNGRRHGAIAPILRWNIT